MSADQITQEHRLRMDMGDSWVCAAPGCGWRSGALYIKDARPQHQAHLASLIATLDGRRDRNPYRAKS